MRLLAIIPARGGSKGLPGKNIRPLAGKPLIVWSIEQAAAANGVTDIVVSTDAGDIAGIAKEAGASVPFMRPAELAGDAVATEPVMRHALLEMEREHGHYDAVMLLQPTSPFRHAGTLDRAIEQFIASGADSLLGVAESHAFFWQHGPTPTASYDYRKRPRRQDIADHDRQYRETGSIYITARDAFLEGNNRLAGKIELFEMAQEESLEIDTATDFAIVETLMKNSFSA